MNEHMASYIRGELTEALNLISCISVSGDAVDFMAVAKKHLKNALKGLDKEVQENNG